MRDLRKTLGSFAQRLIRKDAVSGVAICLLIACVVLVGIAAFLPSGGGDPADLGKFQGAVTPEEAAQAVMVDYQADNGRLRLMLDPNEKELLRNTRTKRFINAHLRKFNRHVSGRSIKRPGLIKGPNDCLFAVSIGKGNDGSLRARLIARDLSVYDMHPVGERPTKNLGPIHFAPDNVMQPYFSDGDLGFFLDPRGGKDAVSRPVSLIDQGIYNGYSVILSDREGNARARVRATEDGTGVEVKPLGNHGVFLENNPVRDDKAIVVKEGQIAEIGGRFFEAHISSAATMAVTRQKGGSIKRVYPMGRLFHIVGPVALDGAHQSLGIEYMFQEYLMGVPEENLPPGELWLTIDERLQALLSSNLSDLARQSKRGIATAMIMDANTGAILAMAAEPQGYDPEERNAVMDMLSRGQEHRANHGGFRRHVVGSVTKAFHAFLALQIMGDEVADIVLDCNAPETATLFGHRLYGSRKKQMKITSGRVTFDDYLIRSDNTYQQSLGMLLLAGVRSPETELPRRWFYKTKKGVPHLRPLSPDGTEPLQIGGLGGTRNRMRIDMDGPVPTLLKDIFDIEPFSGEGIVGDRSIDVYGEPFLRTAGRVLQRRNPNVERPQDVLLRRSVICAPERARNELDDVKVTYQSTNILYGANGNRWTDAKLCEAFSRMMTQKRVKARLVSRYMDPFSGEIIDLEAAATAETPALEVPNPDSFKTMRRILERVPRRANGRYPEGTAAKMQDAIDLMSKQVPGFTMIGKTGTIDDGRKGDPDSRLFLGTFGLGSPDGFEDRAYTIVVYLKNAVEPDAHFDFVSNQLPLWWQLLSERHAATSQPEPTPENVE